MRLSFAVLAVLLAIGVTHALDIASDDDDNSSICGAHPIKKLVAKIMLKRAFDLHCVFCIDCVRFVEPDLTDNDLVLLLTEMRATMPKLWDAYLAVR